MPQYEGGQEQILADISKTLKYPAGALAAKIEGRAVAVYFTIPITFSVQ